jgi:vacuolar-type H+-ATPase subunit I/STV1
MTTAANIKAARADLDDLKAELPSFHALLAHNESAAQRLRADRAAPEEQAEARGRLSTIRDLLEQHQADVQEAAQRVSDLTRQLEVEAAVKRIKKLEADLDRGRETFASRALETYNGLLDAAATLRAERQRLVDAEAETQSLREQLRDRHRDGDRDLLPHQVKELFDRLGIPRPLGLDHYPARFWGLRRFADTTSSRPVQSRLVGLLDQLTQDPQADPRHLTLERKKETHVARR